MNVVSVALPLPLFREFSYFVPLEWEGKVEVGSVVEVEFKGRFLPGLVHSFEEKTTKELKPILRVIPVSPWSEEILRYVERLSQISFAPLGEVAGLFFPPFLRSQWELLNKRIFLVRPTEEWPIFPSQGMNLFLFKERFGFTSLQLHKMMGKGIFSCSDEHVWRQDVFFTEKNFYWWRILRKEDQMEWLREMVSKALEENKKVLLLFPDFCHLDVFESFLQKAFFGKKLLRYDSRLNAKARMMMYRMVEEDDYEIVLGTRLALFLSFPGTFLHILFDPEEQGYFSEQSPRYHALQILYEKINFWGGTMCVVGSVPPLWVYHRLCDGEFQEREFVPFSIPRFRKVKAVALERKKGKSVVAPSVREELARALSRKERVVVWVQKTGYASALGCRDCGFYYLCPDCEVALRYHLDLRMLSCPLCGKKIKPDDFCPVCGGSFWEGWGEGIERVYEEIQEFFPRHVLRRIDSETPFQENLDAMTFPDIFVGTSSVLQEGILRKSSVLVVLSLDDWLCLSDFNARDDFYGKLYRALSFLGIDVQGILQVFLQGSLESIEKVEQFFKPWREFYGESLEKRKKFGYPPFRYLVRVVGKSRNKNRTTLVLEDLQRMLEKDGMKTDGPFPGTGFRKKGKWTQELAFSFEEEYLPRVFTLFSRWMISVEQKKIKWTVEVER